jgi:hypothetical protein
MSGRIDTDAVLHEEMVRAHSYDPNVDLEGNLLQGEVEAQKRERGHEAPGWLLKEAATEGVIHAVKHFVSHGLGAGLPIVNAAYATLADNLKNLTDGDALRDAVSREPAVAACITLCSDALPEGFRGELGAQLVTTQAARSAVYVDLARRPDFDAIKSGIVENCRDGQRAALDNGVRTQGDLGAAVAAGGAFAERYRHDLAFKLGVDSVVWAAGHGQTIDVGAAPTANVVAVRG